MIIRQQKIIQDEPTNFVWPEFKNEQERIRFYSEKFKDTTFEDAFSEVYGEKIKIKDTLSTIAINALPYEVSVGELIDVSLIAVTKDNVTIDAFNVKENIVCKNNLYKYKKFQKPFEPIAMQAKVIKKDSKQVIVDLIEPIYDVWKEQIALNPIFQYDTKEYKSTIATNLHLINGGYTCKVNVPNVSDFVEDDYFVDAFIPGSQIVLNIETDFSRWEGKTVPVFVTNFMPSPLNPNKMVAVCSAKRYLQHCGNINMINIFKHYTEDTDWWKTFTKTPLQGVVTGVINSSKKCGVFVEIPTYNITGMIMMKPQDIVKYAPQMKIMVNIEGFDLPTYYNDEVGQIQHGLPYVFKEGTNILERCDLKPILKIVE